MIDIEGVVNDAGIQSSLDQLANATGRTQGEILRSRAPTLARYLANATQPAQGADGESLSAREVGRKAVRRDISRAYTTPAKIYEELKNWNNAKVGKAMAREFYKAIKQGDIAGARAVIQRSGIKAKSLDIIAWDNGATHKRARNARGRVAKNHRPAIVTDAKKLKEYTKSREKKVGFAKSGWVTAGKQIKSGGRFAAWMSQPAPGNGSDKTQNTESPAVSLTDRVSYVSAAIRPSYEKAATSSFVRSLVKETDAVLAKQAAKEQARANAKI